MNYMMDMMYTNLDNQSEKVNSADRFQAHAA
jgi:hypothetical protein